jgi:DnaA family protein
MRSGLTLRLNQLGDREKRDLLQQRALARGVQLDGAVADFIMLRAPRDTPALLALFDRLDKASLKTKRPITIPFVKQILEW